jgi:hypothetical protein
VIGGGGAKIMELLGYRLHGLGFELWQGKECFFSPKVSRMAVCPTQSSIQWVCMFLPGQRVAGKQKVSIYLHLFLKLRMSGAMLLFLLCAFRVLNSIKFLLPSIYLVQAYYRFENSPLQT